MELTGRLLDKTYPTELISTVLRRLKHDGYLSESRFAESFIRSRMKRGESPQIAAMKARHKGVDEAALQIALDQALLSYDADAVCRALLKKRDPQGLRRADKRVWQRHARFLQNKGFESAKIVRIMNESVQFEHDD
ncbi:MAG: regulatory protein RecX [Mariprofundus sp.]|nr:regulatory protein RecX [Mariprofundus sp.]